MEIVSCRAPWRPISGAAVLFIEAYQRWLSPRKGFACAHRVAHGGAGCSGYADAALRAEGLAALPTVRARLRACRAAAMASASSKDTEPPNGRKKERWYERLDCGVPDCSPCGGALLPRGRRGADLPGDGGCDVGPCDLSW